MSEQEPTIEDLIERSSLGTPAAKALRARTSDAEVQRIRDHAATLRRLSPGTRVRHERLTHFGVGTVADDQPDQFRGSTYVVWDALPAGVPDALQGEPLGHGNNVLIVVEDQ